MDKEEKMREVDPMTTPRAKSLQLYKDAPMPMVTIFKTLDVSPLVRLKESGYRFNMLMCFCTAQAAHKTPQFRLLPAGEKMLEYDEIGVNTIVADISGGLSTCDLPFCDAPDRFSAIYDELTEKVRLDCTDFELPDRMIIGTSNLAAYDIDGAVNMYSGIFNNPFLIWGKYRRQEDRTLLPVSFQFHHVQMDGLEACEFLERLQGACTNLPHDF